MVLKQGERRKIERVIGQAGADAVRRQRYAAQVRMAAADTAIDATAATAADNDARLDEVEPVITAMIGAIAAQEDRLEAEEAATVAAGTRLDAAEAADVALDARIDPVELSLPLKLQWTSVPASAGTAGTAGEVAYESGFFYVCVAADTWQRVALATWP